MTARVIGRTGKARGVDQAVPEMLTMGSAPDSHVRIESRTVSRRHAQIVQQGAGYYLEDLGSRNGTLLNGEQVKRFPLRHLDVISLGPDIDLIFLEAVGVAEATVRPAVTRATVVWLDGPLAGRAQEIPPERGLVLGREGEMATMAAISRRHAVLSLRADRVTVEDLGSANGTWVNGTPISAVTALGEGDTISLGGLVTLRLSILGGAPQRPAEDGADAPATIMMEPSGLPRRRPLEVPAPFSSPTPATPAKAAPASSPEPAVLPPASAAISPQAAPASSPAQTASAGSDRPTILAPPEPAVGPPRGAAERRVIPPAQEDGTVFAPREPAIAPGIGASRVSPALDPVTFAQPREAADRIPDAISSRARAARRAVDGTVSGPAPVDGAATARDGQRSVWSPPGPATPGGIVGVCLTGPLRVTLDRGTFKIGRQPDSDVVVDSRDVGRDHARLQVRDAEVLIQDLETVNGTFVDDARVTKVTPVPDGSRLRFGTVEFAVSYVRSRRQTE